MMKADRRKALSTVLAAVLTAGCLSCSLYAEEPQTEPEAAVETQAQEAAPQTEAAVPQTEAAAQTTMADPDAFLADIGAAVNDRLAISSSYTEAELSMMTNDEIAQANQKCCESERWLMDRYKDAQFESRNLQFLCSQYLTGLQNQYDAYTCWQEKQDIDAYNELWEAGFAKRAVSVVELKEFYGIEFADISDMQEKADELEAMDELASGKVSEEMTRKVQTCLNTLQFPVGEVDGYCGDRTVLMVRRFQKLYGYDPADGVIDDELVAQLQAEADKVAPPAQEPSETEEGENAG